MRVGGEGLNAPAQGWTSALPVPESASCGTSPAGIVFLCHLPSGRRWEPTSAPTEEVINILR